MRTKSVILRKVVFEGSYLEIRNAKVVAIKAEVIKKMKLFGSCGRV